jgi:hypothetical protein
MHEHSADQRNGCRYRHGPVPPEAGSHERFSMSLQLSGSCHDAAAAHTGPHETVSAKNWR